MRAPHLRFRAFRGFKYISVSGLVVWPATERLSHFSLFLSVPLIAPVQCLFYLIL